MSAPTMMTGTEIANMRDLKPYARNLRTHSKDQIRQIADSIRTFGWTNPVLIDEAGGVLAGHGRIEAAKLLGLDEVPVIRLDHMSAAEKRAYILADNKLAENAGWDEELLAIELGLLLEQVDFDIGLTGFSMGEIDLLIGVDESDEAPVHLPASDARPVNRLGDAWSVGPHRLVCGDALDPAMYDTLLEGRSVQMVFTDPPYNVPVDGHVSGLGKSRHREFAMASGEMSASEFAGFLQSVFACMRNALADGAIIYACIDWRHMGEMLGAGHAVFDELKNLCVWAKTNAGMGSFYRSQHELVFVWKAGRGRHINNFGLGEDGRHRSNLWTYPGANTFREGRLEDLAAHPTVKPIDLVRDAIMDCSHRGNVVLDPFAGSGTTLIAAAETGRIGAGIEIDPLYADLTLRRLEAATGETAVNDDTFASFAELAAARTDGEAR